MSQALDSLYREVILEHYHSPRNFGRLEKPTRTVEGFNPVCGDRVKIDLNLSPPTGEKPSVIEKIGFTGEGCSICMASASILAEEVEGLSVEKAFGRIEQVRDLMQSHVTPESIGGDLEALSGVRNFPVRIKCALLPWTTLKDGLSKND